MELDDRPFTHETATPLVVADWKIDAEAVVTICGQRLARASAVHVVAAAWLHGLDWAGDPFASVPCARCQLDRISRVCLHAGLRVISADVGDPDPLNAISDALDHRTIDQILLFARGRHVAAAYPFSVAHRAERLTGLAVHSFTAPSAPKAPGRRRFAAGQCDRVQPPALAGVGR
jgi:hypothetical protein